MLILTGTSTRVPAFRRADWTTFPRRVRRFAGALALLVATTMFAGCGGGDDGGASGDDANRGSAANGGGSKKQIERIDPDDVPVPQVQTGVCRVYTPETGFYVLIDGQLVRDEASGEWITTPCAVTLPVGNHDVKVAKEGYRDTPLPGRVSVTADAEAEVILEPQEDPLRLTESVLAAPYLQAKVGEPMALESLNSTGLETDPFVTADGLAIYFVGKRTEGDGIYYATRPSPYVEFYPPQLLQASRGFDEKATPSVTADARTVAFAMPDKQRVVGLKRESPLGDFIDKSILGFSTDSTEVWRSAQLLGDGLRFYWTIERGGGMETRVSSRKAADEEFGNVLRVALPGVHPCLSSDGLRQYAFDGKSVSRARRAKATSKFSRLEEIATVSLDNYTHDDKRRQFYVSDDEQWLYYCDDPSGNGDLYMVRLSQGAGWGFAAHGKSIPQRTFVAENKPTDTANPRENPDPEPEVDPRTLPLPYTTHWKNFTGLMQAKKYQEAGQLVKKSLADGKLSGDRELLEWDGEEVARVIAFRDDVRKALQQMKPGATVRFGPARAELVKFEDDVITASLSTKEIVKPIAEMSPTDLVAIADELIEKEDEAGQARMGTFLYYDTAGNAGSAEARFNRAGEAGKQFYERQATRVIQQARQEFEREKIAEGLVFAAKVMEEFPRTEAAAAAKELEQKAYQFTKWQERGRWKTGADGEYIAATGRVADSYLMSPRKYENFELRLEWKTEAGGAGGVFFRYRGSGDPNLFGYKIQMTDDFGSGSVDPQTTGALLNEAPPARNAVRQRGEWNTLRMQVRGTQVMVEINGVKVQERSAAEDNFKAASGYVMLDGVTGGITYRRTLLMELAPE